MNKPYIFKEQETENIIKHFGREFYEDVARKMERFAHKWTLTSFELIPSYSANLVFKCHAANYGRVVLKIGRPSSGEINAEFNTLRHYNGKRFCKVIDADIENALLLEECVEPGKPLREETNLHQRLAVFCSLYDGLHLPPDKENSYPAYSGWVGRITEYMSKREDCIELYGHMKKAQDIHTSISALYSQTMLLHGDFHHDNILLGKEGAYIIIDPKGVLGDPVFDIPRFILNEFDDEITAETYRKINEIIAILEKNLQIPNAILKQCLYVETAMGICWSVEDGSTPEEYPGLLRTVAFAESLLGT
ncbi:aminoglycoside phosphotransferase family protein [Paenibacillus nasutitermitis]|uniref:Aminoglycoside resistance protein n=1 Tax=Paenibacillus nasutitermitis TaxID=1652958 RepID=A0A916YTX8_9BACL|nr:aminoglycoside phosphotransferase family protein [Paenibacillus nasutitermitis]GGD60017.1 hypothetical protein GCM10010911_17360 [Paenibacillus nasutitermitis]